MSNRIRFYFALFVGKLTSFALKCVNKYGFYPGRIVYHIAPDFLSMIELPETIVAVTGTNGKTTTTNFLAQSFDFLGLDYCSNVWGSNTVSATISLLLMHTKWNGKSKRKIALLEVDEKSTDKVFEYIKPDYLLCTNIYRDSYKNNGHVEYILNFLERYIPDGVKMILNADDLPLAELKKNNPRVYYSLAPLPTEAQFNESVIRDLILCPRCDHELQGDFIRYQHIGRYHCEACGYASPRAEYEVTEADYERGEMLLVHRGERYRFKLNIQNDTDVYNLLGAFSLLSEMGFSLETIQSFSERLAVVKSRRIQRTERGPYSLTMMMAKGMNPVANSRAFDWIRRQTGPLALVMMNFEAVWDENNAEVSSWIYDSDFASLKSENIVQFVLCGRQNRDVKLNLLLEKIPEANICLCDAGERPVDALDFGKVRHVYLLSDMDSLALAEQARSAILEKMQELSRAGDSE